jgi:hypothetical protein
MKWCIKHACWYRLAVHTDCPKCLANEPHFIRDNEKELRFFFSKCYVHQLIENGWVKTKNG